MKVMKRETWPALMKKAKRSVLILAPWIDDELIDELFCFLPPIEVKILFPQTTLEEKGHKQFRYYLREVSDINLDAEVRVVDEEIPACLVVDGEEFFFPETYSELLKDKGGKDTKTGIAYAMRAWELGNPWS